ncbi:uncharacterized protein LOC126828403 [Patella vulgata]|uniref:uncharacterized protein LOC126828403 n=1 Tax=Patella vulgata TaxID=6465 RepID=UPI002180390F|nr:uncharacterized protein LOC126828403 [Patella vulgata]XP_050414151.1 uncharacterized protein LOC126828403 [Patella vulgata]
MIAIRNVVVLAAFFGFSVAQVSDCNSPPECYFPQQLNTQTCQCYCTYQPSSDPTKYEVVIPNYPSIEMNCPVTLVWNQTLCQCGEDMRGLPTAPTVGGNTVTCQTLVDLRGNGTQFVNFANYYSKNENYQDILLEKVDGASNVDGAANFKGISLYLPVFKYNDLTGTAMMKLRVRPTEETGHIYKNNDQVILSNACTGSPAAIELTYSPAQRNFTLTIHTSGSNQEMCENIAASPNGWYDIDVSILNGSTAWSINGIACPQITGSGSIKKTECGLTVGGNPVASNDSEDFYGHIDSVKIVKHCDTEKMA